MTAWVIQTVTWLNPKDTCDNILVYLYAIVAKKIYGGHLEDTKKKGYMSSI